MERLILDVLELDSTEVGNDVVTMKVIFYTDYSVQIDMRTEDDTLTFNCSDIDSILTFLTKNRDIFYQNAYIGQKLLSGEYSDLLKEKKQLKDRIKSFYEKVEVSKLEK